MNAYKDVADQGIEPRSDTRKVPVLTNRRNGQNGRKRPKKEIILTKTKKLCRTLCWIQTNISRTKILRPKSLDEKGKCIISS